MGGGAVAHLRLQRLVGLPLGLDGDDGDVLALVLEQHLVANLGVLAGGVEDDGHAKEKVAAGQAHLLDAVSVHVLVHEARERAEATHSEQLDVARVPVGELEGAVARGDEAGLLRLVSHEVHELAAVGLDETGGVRRGGGSVEEGLTGGERADEAGASLREWRERAAAWSATFGGVRVEVTFPIDRRHPANGRLGCGSGREIGRRESCVGVPMRSRWHRGRIEPPGPALGPAAFTDRGRLGTTRPQDFSPLEGVHFYPHLRAEFTSEDGAGGARLGDEASGGAAPRGDGGDLAERTADGTHRGHLVRSCCEVSLIRSMLLRPRPRVRVAGLGFVSDCLRVRTCLGAHFPKSPKNRTTPKLSPVCRVRCFFNLPR